MHESDAMDFIYEVLSGFLKRNFNIEIARDNLYLEKIRDFIKNDPPYWVKYKALTIIYAINFFEDSIRAGTYTPTSIKRIISNILKEANGIIELHVESMLTGSNGWKITMYEPLPTFPSRSPLNKMIEEARTGLIPTETIFQEWDILKRRLIPNPVILAKPNSDPQIEKNLNAFLHRFFDVSAEYRAEILEHIPLEIQGSLAYRIQKATDHLHFLFEGMRGIHLPYRFDPLEVLYVQFRKALLDRYI